MLIFRGVALKAPFKRFSVENAPNPNAAWEPRWEAAKERGGFNDQWDDEAHVVRGRSCFCLGFWHQHRVLAGKSACRIKPLLRCMTTNLPFYTRLKCLGNLPLPFPLMIMEVEHLLQRKRLSWRDQFFHCLPCTWRLTWLVEHPVVAEGRAFVSSAFFSSSPSPWFLEILFFLLEGNTRKITFTMCC